MVLVHVVLRYCDGSIRLLCSYFGASVVWFASLVVCMRYAVGCGGISLLLCLYYVDNVLVSLWCSCYYSSIAVLLYCVWDRGVVTLQVLWYRYVVGCC